MTKLTKLERLKEKVVDAAAAYDAVFAAYAADAWDAYADAYDELDEYLKAHQAASVALSAAEDIKESAEVSYAKRQRFYAKLNLELENLKEQDV